MSGARLITSAIEKDMERSQFLLPFPEEKTIDMARCCGILHVSPHVVRRLMVTPDGEEMCLRGYNTMRCAPLRIDYESVVGFLDRLRERHGIPDRRPPAIFGRRRDEELLPFRWSDTIAVEEAADALSIHRSKVLLRIEAGQFEAYQLVKWSPWRISRTSLTRLISTFQNGSRGVRPYGPAQPQKSSEAAPENTPKIAPQYAPKRAHI